jgi:hypothetical protein
VGATLDARDKELRGKLGLVKDNGSAVGAAHCKSAAAEHRSSALQRRACSLLLEIRWFGASARAAAAR